MAIHNAVPSNYSLSDMMATYMRHRFLNEAFLDINSTPPDILLSLLVDATIAMNQVVSTITQAYHNRSEHIPGYLQFLSVSSPLVVCSIDLIRLLESLTSMQPGTNEEQESRVLQKHPSSLSGMLDCPTIILGEGDTIALWYLPGALAPCIQVRICSIHIFHVHYPAFNLGCRTILQTPLILLLICWKKVLPINHGVQHTSISRRT